MLVPFNRSVRRPETVEASAGRLSRRGQTPVQVQRASPAPLVLFAAAHAGVSARACGDVPIVYAF